MRYALVAVFAFSFLFVSSNAEAMNRVRLSPGVSIESRLCKQVEWLFSRFPTPPPLPVICGGPASAPAPQPNPEPTPECPEPEPEPEPEPSVGHVLISEVYYDVDSAHGSEPAHEWVELYNPTGAAVVLDGWSVVDTSGSVDMLPAGTTIPAQGFIVLAASSTLRDFWSIPQQVAVINLGGSLGNALGNTNDAFMLKNQASTTVDALSWGTDTTAFDPAAPDAAEGHSLARLSLDVDTDAAADWVDREVPTPGR